MSNSARVIGLQKSLDSFKPDRHHSLRAVGLFSASLAVADEESIKVAAESARAHSVQDSQLYEVVLQSYLFLGFPRMLTAATVLNYSPMASDIEKLAGPPQPGESESWYERGLELCKRVYDSNYERLRARVVGMAPEIFRWMILEGYGKVLTRPGLDIVGREAAIVGCLTIENRPSQLYAHSRGALNVGAPPEMLIDLIDDLRYAAGDGYETARGILRRLGVI